MTADALDSHLRSELTRIRDDARNSSRSVADALLRVVSLAGDLGSPELQEWAERELSRYAGISMDEIPDYRRPPVALLMDWINPHAQMTGQPVTKDLIAYDDVWDDVSRAVLLGGARELERIADADTPLTLSAPAPEILAQLIRHRTQTSSQILRVYWSVPSHVVLGAVDQIRTRLVKMLATYSLASHTASPTEAARETITILTGTRQVQLVGADNFVLAPEPRWKQAVKVAGWLVGAAIAAAGAWFGYLALHQ